MSIPKLEDIKAYWEAFRKLPIISKWIIIFVVLVSLCVWFYFRETKINNLETTIETLNNRIRDKDTEIQRLETELVPFKVYALEHYPGPEKEALSQLVKKIRDMEDTVDAIKNYSDVSQLDFAGFPYNVSPPLTYSSKLTEMLKGCYVKKEDGYYPNCGVEVEEKYKKVIESFPKFPFSYYGLALCLEEKGDKSWKVYAEKAVEIFKKTTSISGHNVNHDQCLKILQDLLNKDEK